MFLLLTTPQVLLFGPLLDNAVVSHNVLPHAFRQTCINIFQRCLRIERPCVASSQRGLLLFCVEHALTLRAARHPAKLISRPWRTSRSQSHSQHSSRTSSASHGTRRSQAEMYLQYKSRCDRPKPLRQQRASAGRCCAILTLLRSMLLCCARPNAPIPAHRRLRRSVLAPPTRPTVPAERA